MRFERGLPMKNKRMRYISITAAILLVFVLLMLLFSNRSGNFSAMEAQDGVLDATSADFSSAVYEIDGEWTFYPEVLGSEMCIRDRSLRIYLFRKAGIRLRINENGYHIFVFVR